MKDPIEVNSLDTENEQNLLKEWEQKKKIIKCLNDFEEIIELNPIFRSPLNFTETDINIIYEQIILKIRNLKETLVVEKSLEELYLTIFELLFLDSYKINTDQLDEKISIINILLNALKDNPEEEKEIEFINKIKEKKKEWENIINAFSNKFGGLAFIFCIFLNYSKSLGQVVEFFIYCMQTLYTCSVKFDIKEINSIPEEIIAKDLYFFIEDNTNYFYFIIENGHIIKSKFNNNETEFSIKNEMHFEQKQKKEKRKRKRKKH